MSEKEVHKSFFQTVWYDKDEKRTEICSFHITWAEKYKKKTLLLQKKCMTACAHPMCLRKQNMTSQFIYLKHMELGSHKVHAFFPLVCAYFFGHWALMAVFMEKALCSVLTLSFSFSLSSPVLGNRSVQGRPREALIGHWGMRMHTPYSKG